MAALIPSFRIYKEGKIPVQTLWNAFIVRTHANLKTLPSKIGRSGTIYNIVLDVPADRIVDKIVPCVISYQEHSYGNFAVFRIDNQRLTQSAGKAKNISNRGKRHGK